MQNVDFDAAVAKYMKKHACFFEDPEQVARNIKVRLIDDRMRAILMDGLMQCSLHLRFLIADILSENNDAFDLELLDQLDLNGLCELLWELDDVYILYGLSVACGVYRARIVMTMLKNMQKLWNDLRLLVPYHRLEGFEPLPLADQHVYEFPLKADPKNPSYTDNGVFCAVAAICTIMDKIPLGNLWIEEYQNFMAEIEQEA